MYGVAAPHHAAMNCDNQVRALLDWAYSDAAFSVAQGQTAFPDHLRGPVADLVQAANSTDEQLRTAALKAVFAQVVEPCNDRLDRAGRNAYAAVFPAIVWAACMADPGLRDACAQAGIVDEQACYRGYARRRQRGHAPQSLNLPAKVRRVLVLSRVTIGADILLTSLLCQRVHQAFPQAEVVVVGDGKLQGLLGGWPWLRVCPLRYQRRGGLSERLHSWLALREVQESERPDCVLSPDSRLDQLGILPVADDDHCYALWENIQDQEQPQSLADLLDAWACTLFALPHESVVHPSLAWDETTTAAHGQWQECLQGRRSCACKWDHGGNPLKALPQMAEVQIMRHCMEQGWFLVVDRGFGDEERAASDALLRAGGWDCLDVDEDGVIGVRPEDLTPSQLAGHAILRFHGSIAGWSALQAACGLTLAYDSVGHHLAAASGVPVISICTGHSHANFPIAWQPRGPAAVTQIVIPTDERDQPQHWQRVLTACAAAGAR
ncbi:MAG: hypothetical protein EA401_13590 [Planctomycetota bacterium]|nr:MAG: hypothetical protein EA401_13590 [Planctomycetota bacterium]